MKTWIVDRFHPMHLWCRCGGRCQWLFEWYEFHVWTLIRRIFK